MSIILTMVIMGVNVINDYLSFNITVDGQKIVARPGEGKDELRVDGNIAIANHSDKAVELFVLYRIAEAIRLRVFDSEKKLIAVLDASAAYADKELRKLTIESKENKMESLKMPWPIRQQQKAFEPGAEMTVVVELLQGKAVYRSRPVPFVLMPGGQKRGHRGHRTGHRTLLRLKKSTAPFSESGAPLFRINVHREKERDRPWSGRRSFGPDCPS